MANELWHRGSSAGIKKKEQEAEYFGGMEEALKVIAPIQAEIDALVEWVRYEMEEAGADDEKDEAHNADGTKLLEKHK